MTSPPGPLFLAGEGESRKASGFLLPRGRGAGGGASRRLILAAALLAALALVAFWAGRFEARPARCPEGLVPLGPRCCGEGQRLEEGSCRGAPSRCAEGMRRAAEGCVAKPGRVRIEGGVLRVGPSDWEAEGRVSAREAKVESFLLDRLEVTEARYRTCAARGACAPAAPGALSGEPGRPVTRLTQPEAAAFCEAEGGRLPTRDELAFAAAGAKGRRYAWGDTGAVCRRAAFGLVSGPCGEEARGPDLAGARPDGASPEGALDLAGNVAEWTAGAERLVEVRGGSFRDGAAAALRAWHARELDPGARLDDVGFRCAYDL